MSTRRCRQSTLVPKRRAGRLVGSKRWIGNDKDKAPCSRLIYSRRLEHVDSKLEGERLHAQALPNDAVSRVRRLEPEHRSSSSARRVHFNGPSKNFIHSRLDEASVLAVYFLLSCISG